MYLDRIVYPVYALGPGRRLVLWTKGCSKHCQGCANPELWETTGSQNVSVENLIRIMKNIHRETPIDGITISGGDPLEQKKELLNLIAGAGEITSDILIYTGYTWEYLQKNLNAEEQHQLKEYTAVLIDGPYIAALNNHSLTLRGSANQRILYFHEDMIPRYEEYLAEGRKIQNVMMGKRLISIGIHDLETSLI